MNFQVQRGVYPTMITPYTKNGEIDYHAVDSLVEWYWEQGCDGIFAACQSSEIMFLSLEERVKLTGAVVKKAKELAEEDKSRAPMQIVASGHVSDSLEDQVRELCAIAAEGPDALILISNRMDIENTTDEKWIEDTERLIAQLPMDMPLGVYECPKPYKRLLSERMLQWCADTGRFYFVKDTCCDAEMIARRLEICEGSQLKIFNANAQTLLATVKNGCYGYCGVMANFHPALYVKLLRGDHGEKENSLLQDFLGLAAELETNTYPCCAKYYLDRHEHIPMEWTARSNDVTNFTPYQQSNIDRMAELAEAFAERW
ncbi:MAG: dihydrodipicolinate synthase family protein [Ruminococcaceae bacterium]|nr:dihydrodipicolinate synthase family protein [Oscillospiraceae bacterium]